MDDETTAGWLSDLPWDDPSRKSNSKPRLRRFVHWDKPILYLELLGTGGEGQVFRVKIEGKIYVLKIFHEWHYVGMPLPEKLQQFTSPFAHEARAFARLDCIGENGTWAVKCHGWMRLTYDHLLPIDRHCPPDIVSWAIVKDYIPETVQLTDVPEIRRKMEIAYRASIFPIDILPRNYRGSFLVDLGSSMTWPYIRKLWGSDRAFDIEFERVDNLVSSWEISDVDGVTVVNGDENRIRRKLKEQEQRMRKQAEELKNSESHPADHVNRLVVE
ncbi:hypothetical protein FQN54_004110 [Arachnomyces sp. PD_36]|nr:hypothetical protein FQN54_004110 [Arachnomyces sp. PD_36]